MLFTMSESSLTPSPQESHSESRCCAGQSENACGDTAEIVLASSHEHTHSHSHDHSHGHAASRKRLAIALAITATIFIAELVAAFFTSSLSLAADAGHMAVDSAGLIIAFIAASLAMRPRDNRRTWGWARSEVLAAAFQAGMLVIISLLVAIEGIQRLVSPVEVRATPMLWVGILGLVANALSLMVLIGGRHASLNMRAAVLEVANDALGSFAVIIAATVELIGGWSRADALASIFIALLMAPRACMLLLRTLRILMEEVPAEINLEQVRQHMLSIPLVEDVHDLHVSSVASNLVTVTAHIEVSEAVTAGQRDQIIHSLNECAMHHFPIEIAHSTFQVESISHAQHEHLRH